MCGVCSAAIQGRDDKDDISWFFEDDGEDATTTVPDTQHHAADSSDERLALLAEGLSHGATAAMALAHSAVELLGGEVSEHTSCVVQCMHTPLWQGVCADAVMVEHQLLRPQRASRVHAGQARGGAALALTMPATLSVQGRRCSWRRLCTRRLCCAHTGADLPRTVRYLAIEGRVGVCVRDQLQGTGVTMLTVRAMLWSRVATWRCAGIGGVGQRDASGKRPGVQQTPSLSRMLIFGCSQHVSVGCSVDDHDAIEAWLRTQQATQHCATSAMSWALRGACGACMHEGCGCRLCCCSRQPHSPIAKERHWHEQA